MTEPTEIDGPPRRLPPAREKGRVRTDETPDARASVSPREGVRGLTTKEVARRLRVSEDKVRLWIARRELVGINTSATACGKPRWVVTPEALAEFEKRRAGGDPPKPERRRRTVGRDYYPDK